MILLIIPVIVGITRIIRGVHYPSDVLGGMIIGVFAGLVGFVVSTKLVPVISDKSE
ncbi:MAG: phosphatase PAP2 family protein [Anaerolineaceae bacterium]|nr:phosphatase PAP2 family protein [Anaerolineaceae bacterium]